MTAFVPCPACGGPVHPIAGRCKHCKTDLVKLREAYAQAQRSALMGVPQRPVAPPGAPQPPPGVQPPAPAPLPQATAAGYQAYGAPAGSPWVRRWPLIVGGAAVLVIAISLVVLFRGHSASADSPNTTGTSRSPHPIPDDMNTPQGPLGQNPPPPGSPTDPNPHPDPGRPHLPGQRPAPTDGASFAAAMVETLCSRISDCGVGDPGTRQMCSQMGSMIDPGMPGGSPQCTIDNSAVNACFSAIENISCDTIRSADIGALLSDSSLQQCTQACI
jgi:hypothetical protein